MQVAHPAPSGGHHVWRERAAHVVHDSAFWAVIGAVLFLVLMMFLLSKSGDIPMPPMYEFPYVPV